MKKIMSMVRGAGALYVYQQSQKPSEKKIKQLLDQWTQVLQNGSVEQIVSLYCQKAILLATYSPKIRIGHKAIADYFIDLKQKQGLGCQLLSFYSQTSLTTGIASGEYRFFWDGGEAYARYTFVFEKGLIINHHSSEIPKP